LSQSGAVETVSFDGIKTVTSSFVNAAFVPLLKSYRLAEIERRLVVVDSTWRIYDSIKCTLGAGNQQREYMKRLQADRSCSNHIKQPEPGREYMKQLKAEVGAELTCSAARPGGAASLFARLRGRMVLGYDEVVGYNGFGRYIGDQAASIDVGYYAKAALPKPACNVHNDPVGSYGPANGYMAYQHINADVDRQHFQAPIPVAPLLSRVSRQPSYSPPFHPSLLQP
jgi:STAS-like domain of unknown function (DUF4325)